MKLLNNGIPNLIFEKCSFFDNCLPTHTISVDEPKCDIITLRMKIVKKIIKKCRTKFAKCLEKGGCYIMKKCDIHTNINIYNNIILWY